MPRTRNVVLFGECGVGKSSIINAIAGQRLADTSNNVLGCTTENARYTVTLDSGVQLQLWDTIGLDEGTAGSVPAKKARKGLKDFLETQIASPDGIDLLLYCFRGANGKKGSHVKRGHRETYTFVFEYLCEKRVPIAMIVTNLESYNPGGDMGTWWDDNEQRLAELGLQFCAHACVCVLPAELCSPHDDVGRIEESRSKLRELLSRDFLAPRSVLLLGAPEDRNDFIDATTASSGSKKQDSIHQPEGTPLFTRIPVAFDAHTHVNFWNTSKFDETDDDVLITGKNLKSLVQGMYHTAGIDLLLFCFRAGRPKARHARLYRFFHAAICRKKVPIAVAVLGAETDTDTWWKRNELDLQRIGLRFDGHVYIPGDPCQYPSGPLDDRTRSRLIDLVQQEHTSGRWTICNDPFWVTVPNVRAVVGELSWPTTTVVVCDATGENALVRVVPAVQSSLQCVTGTQREYRFQQVDPQSLTPVVGQPSSNAHPYIQDQGNKGIGLLMFFLSANRLDNEAWNRLERFYVYYNGNITPCVVVVYGIPERRPAENIWELAPRRIKRRIGVYVAYYPGPNTCSDVQGDAQSLVVDLVRDLCLMDLGEKVGLLREILSVWKKYRSQHRVSDGTSG